MRAMWGELGGHPFTTMPHQRCLLPSSVLPPALASLHEQGSGPWEWMAPRLCLGFEASQECEASFLSLPLPRPRCSAVAAACSSEIFPLLLSLCIWEPDVIGRPITGSHYADAGLGGGRKDGIEVFPLISGSLGYLVRFGFRGRARF